ncbi:uncharacterized protein LOC106640538 [Copidosoma floridanum]|uniref:uncharacterized protein LOC106640538 n=1 Tax=Copidosoma floridanum TaxID=29053 RepID=UPI0006C9801C|nr:uncharacterized protein LOC106640538 [Copidosoma floridanum]
MYLSSIYKVVLAGVSEEALKNRLPLISWGLARHGGPNAAQLARLTMLRVGAGLFLEKLLQPQCIGARNSKTRENTLQLLIFSLVTFPSTEFKVKSAIDKVVIMVGDRRKRVRHSALDTLAILSQIYDSEDILEASKRYTKGKPDGPMIHAAIKTRLSRKLLPNVSSDGLVVYGLQISSNSQYTGADVEWIVAGSGSVSPGTGRTRGQLITMSKRENDESELTDYAKKPKARPSSERSLSSGLEKDERTSSWKLLPQTDENDKPRRKVDRASKSADVSKAHTPAFELHSNQVLKEEEEEEDRTREPYSTPKRRLEGPSPNGEPVKPASTDESSTQGRVSSSAPPPRHESRIPVYMGTKAASPESSRKDSCWSEDALRPNANSSYPRMLQKRSWDVGKSAAPRTSYTISYAYPGRYVHPRYRDSCEEARNDPVLQKCREKPKGGFRENQRVFSYEKLNRGVDDGARHPRGFDESSGYRYTSRTCTETYETIYQRQRRLKESRGSAPGVPLYGHAYEGYVADVKFPVERVSVGMVKGTSRTQAESSPQKRNAFATPFDQSTMAIGKENIQHREANGNKPRVLNGGSKSATTISASDRAPSPRQGGGEARSSSGSSLSSNRSVSSRTRSRPALPAHTESDESNTTENKSFNVISAEKRHSLHDAPDVPQPLRPSSDSEDELRPPGQSSSANSSSGRLNDQPSTNFGRSRSALSIDKVPPIKRQPAAKHSLESLLREANGTAKPREDVHLPPLQCNGHGDQSSSVKSSPASGSSISERAFSARRSSKSITELNNHPAKESSESPADESVTFETLDFRNGVSATRRSTSATLADSPPGPRPLYANSNVSLYSSDSTTMSPSSPKRFVSQSMPVIARATDSDDPSPVPIGFDDGRLDESYSEDGSDGSHDELAGNKPQVSRLPTPVDLPKKLCKLSPCRLRPQRNCQRALPSVTSRHHDKHPEKTSKAVQQCLAQLDSSAWEMTLKGLRMLAQLAKEEPEQLDACVPGLLPRVLGKHVKNLRSQVARVACSTTSDVFRAHVRGIEQDLDEVAGVLLHRTADTNRFLREDCNAALDSMIEHFPPHRTIMTIVNRGAKHQNTVVHATTARLLYSIVSEIGPDCAMALPREVRDKLFSTTAKLLTDGNLQARKHAKETFRLLVPCEGFRKALTDSVPESTLRLIEKTLRSL